VIIGARVFLNFTNSSKLKKGEGNEESSLLCSKSSLLFILDLQGKLFNIVTQAEYVLLLTQERLATGLLRWDLVYSLAAGA